VILLIKVIRLVLANKTFISNLHSGQTLPTINIRLLNGLNNNLFITRFRGIATQIYNYNKGSMIFNKSWQIKVINLSIFNQEETLLLTCLIKDNLFICNNILHKSLHFNSHSTIYNNSIIPDL
jgi:hypothetical protein